jgi:hypothetical protein
MSMFQIELNDYPHFNLTKDGRLCSMGQHCPGFPRVLYDTLIPLSYDGDAPVYHCQLPTAHVMDQCEVSVMIPFDPIELWSGSVIGRQQRMHLTAYEESATATTQEIERLRHENTILLSSALPPSELNRELQVVYRRLSGAEHGWNYTRMLLNIAREEVDIRTHRIVHLENHVET